MVYPIPPSNLTLHHGPSTDPSPATRIPPEVINLILKWCIHHIYQANSRPTENASREAAGKFRSYFVGYALVSKAWLGPVRELLYLHVHFSDEEVIDFGKLARSLCERNLGKFVRRLSLGSSAWVSDGMEVGAYGKGEYTDNVWREEIGLERVIPRCPFVKELFIDLKSVRDYGGDPDPDGRIWRALTKIGLKGDDGGLYKGAGLDWVTITTLFRWRFGDRNDTQDGCSMNPSWSSVLKSPGWRSLKRLSFGLGGSGGAFRGFDPSHYRSISNAGSMAYERGYEVPLLTSLEFANCFRILNKHCFPFLPPGADSNLTSLSIHKSSVSAQLLLNFISFCGKNLTVFCHVQSGSGDDVIPADLRFPSHLISEFPQFGLDRMLFRSNSTSSVEEGDARVGWSRKCYLMDSIALICRSLERVEIEDCILDRFFDPDRKLLSRFGPMLQSLVIDEWRIQIGPDRDNRSGGLAEELMRRGSKRGGSLARLHISRLGQGYEGWYHDRMDQEALQTEEGDALEGDNAAFGRGLPAKVRIWTDATHAAKEAGVDLVLGKKRYQCGPIGSV